MDLLSLLVLLVVAVVVVLSVVFITRGVFARDLTQALQRVMQQEQSLHEQADILEQRIRQLEMEYQAKLKRADAEGERLILDAKNQAMNIRTAAIEEAKHRARQLLLEAEQGRSQLKVEAAREMNGTALRQACEALRGFLPPAQLEAMHATLGEEALAEAERLDGAAAKRQTTRVVVAAAQALPEAARTRLARWAAATLGPEIPVDVDITPELVAGCVIRLGATIIDSSLLLCLSGGAVIPPPGSGGN